MSRADRLKGEGVREKEKHEAEVKQLVQTLKVATGPPEMEDPSSQLRDGLGEPFPSERGCVDACDPTHLSDCLSIHFLS